MSEATSSIQRSLMLPKMVMFYCRSIKDNGCVSGTAKVMPSVKSVLEIITFLPGLFGMDVR